MKFGAHAVVLSTYLIALVLTMVPLAPELRWWRPEFVALVTLFWVLMLPEQLSMLGVFAMGVLLDLLEGVALGQNALGLLVVAYLCLLSYQRVRNYRILHQTFFVFVFIGLYQLLGNWVHSLQGASAHGLTFLMPAVSSALIWPIARQILHRVRISYRMG